MQAVELTLLGNFAMRADGTLLTLTRAPLVALLTYLAVEANAQPRSAVAGLLWPDQSEAEARNSLRQVLHQARNLPVPLIAATRQTVALSDAVTLTCDLHTVNRALAADDLTTAVTHYTAPLLGDRVVWDSPLYNEWLLLQREQLHRRMMAAYARLLASAEQRADWPAVEHLALRQLSHDPWREAAHRSLIQALAAQGRRAAALEQYERCRELLDETFGVPPGEQTRALHTALVRDEPVSPPPPPVRPLPLPPGALIGRDALLHAALAALAAPDGRLLTIVGAGGMGKTRLALAVAHAVRAQGQPVTWVDLAAVSADAPAGLTTALADALGLTLQLQPAPVSQIATYLNQHPQLLVIDNLEHLLDQSAALLTLLQAAPATQLLVTSRERLNVRAERLLPVAGLPEDAAVALFVEVARQIGVPLRSADQLATVRAICRHVDGMPLALELLARWLRVLDVQAIAAELTRGLAIVATQARDVPARHRTLHAVIDWSWQRLSAAERAALAQLAVFEGGCDRQAAQAVAGADFWLLDGLVERSLLQRSGARYTLHPLVRHFALAQLGPAADATWQRLADHYAHVITAPPDDAFTSDIVALTAAWRPELTNFHNAWRWLVTHEQYTALPPVHDRLFAFYAALGRYKDVLDWYDWTLAHIGDDRRLDADLRTRIFRARSYFRVQIGDYGGAQADAEQCLALGQAHHLPIAVALGYHMLGIIEDYRGQPKLSRDHLRHALDLLPPDADPVHRQVIVNSLGLTEFVLGNYVEAERHNRAALQLARQNGKRLSESMYLANLANTLWAIGRTAEALPLYETALSIEQELDRPSGISTITRSIAECYDRLGRVSEAIALKEAALAIDRAHDLQWNIGYGLWTLAESHLLAGDLAQAAAVAREGLAFSSAHDEATTVAACRGTLGKIAAAGNDYATARQQLAAALRADGLYAFQRADFQAALDNLPT